MMSVIFEGRTKRQRGVVLASLQQNSGGFFTRSSRLFSHSVMLSYKRRVHLDAQHGQQQGFFFRFRYVLVVSHFFFLFMCA